MLRDRIEKRVVVAIVIVLFVLSSVMATLGQEIPARWAPPVVLAALLVIILQISPVEEIHRDVRFLRELTVGVKVKTSDSIRKFYGDLLHALNSAEKTLDLTHIRDQPPDEFGESSTGYFEGVLKWLNEDSDRSVRRIISVRNRKMRAWAQYLATQCEEYPGFQVRVIEWTIDAPAINVAIIDGQAVFLALTGEALQRTGGVALEDERVARFFSDYYDNLFNAATPLATYLAGGDALA
jgi:hypothetical protein